MTTSFKLLYFECEKHLGLTFSFKGFQADFKFPLKVTECFWCILFCFVFFIFDTSKTFKDNKL